MGVRTPDKHDDCIEACLDDIRTYDSAPTVKITFMEKIKC